MFKNPLMGGFCALLFLLAAPSVTAQAAEICPDVAPPTVLVNMIEKKALFDVKQNKVQLAAYHIDTADVPFHAEVGGLMRGNIRYDRRIRYGRQVNKNNGQACLWVQDVTLNVYFEPSVYVAQEYKDDACWFREIFAHEAEHVAIDRDIARKYKSRLRQGMSFVLSAPEDYMIGPLPDIVIPDFQKGIDKDLDAAVKALLAGMSRERVERQAAHDNPREYARLSHACMVR
ncbi:MAG: hypothetical protein H6868_04895 [Rhodospirillales bacterium]|nr:hypothetical protein [Rhodospirillales bacterium]